MTDTIAETKFGLLTLDELDGEKQPVPIEWTVRASYDLERTKHGSHIYWVDVFIPDDQTDLKVEFSISPESALKLARALEFSAKELLS